MVTRLSNLIAPLGLLLLASAVSACLGREDNDVQERYARQAHAIGLNAVYPPQEDIVVGDVYLVSTNAGNPEDVVRIYLSSLDDYVLNDARVNLAHRIAFLDTTNIDSDPKSTVVAITQKDLGPNNRLRIGNPQGIDSLPVAAYPGITVDAGFSVNGLLSSLGFAGGGRTSVSLDYNDVRTYGASIPNVAEGAKNLIKADLKEGDCARYIHYLSDKLDPRLSHTKRNYSFMVVTRVYLTRSINYTYHNSVIAAAAASQKSPSPGSGQGAFNGTFVVIPAVGPNGDAAAAVEALGKTESGVVTPDGNTSNGLKVGGFSALGLTLVKTFQRPVVIAWEGLTYRFDEFDSCKS